jgi:hypothetical protein
MSSFPKTCGPYHRSLQALSLVQVHQPAQQTQYPARMLGQILSAPREGCGTDSSPSARPAVIEAATSALFPLPYSSASHSFIHPSILPSKQPNNRANNNQNAHFSHSLHCPFRHCPCPCRPGPARAENDGLPWRYHSTRRHHSTRRQR